MTAALAVINNDTNVEAYRASTNAAGLCRGIVVKTAKKIGGRQYVGVEGWQAIAVAHGCTASADDVQRVNDEGMSGFKCIGIVRRMSDGVEIARAEGFLGDDESVWTKRPVYARRAMVQTRAISRACRSAFAHVVVMIDAGLSTTPAEEVPDEGFDNEPRQQQRAAPRPVEQRKPQFITKEQQDELVMLASAKGIDNRTLCEAGGIKSLPDLRADVFDECKQWIAEQPAPKPAGPQASADLSDDIPY